MRAIVISIKENKAAVAFKGGALSYVEDQGYTVGQILELPSPGELTVIDGQKTDQVHPVRLSGRRMDRTLRIGASIAAACLVFIISGVVTVNAAPVSTVTLDVNPSVSYDLNLFDRVVRAKALNDDGEQLLNGLSKRVLFKELPEAVETTLSELRDQDYITEEDTPVAATVDHRFKFGSGKDERLLRELDDSAREWNGEQHGISADMEARKVTRDLRKQATEQGTTPGRVLLNEIHRRREMDQPETPEGMDPEETNRPEIQEQIPASGQPEEDSRNKRIEETAPEAPYDHPSDDRGNDVGEKNQSNEPMTPPEGSVSERNAPDDRMNEQNGTPPESGGQTAPPQDKQDASFTPSSDGGNPPPDRPEGSAYDPGQGSPGQTPDPQQGNEPPSGEPEWHPSEPAENPQDGSSQPPEPPGAMGEGSGAPPAGNMDQPPGLPPSR